MLYADAYAEVRRVHPEAPWVTVAVIVGGNWLPVFPGVHEATERLVESGLVRLVELLPIIAPSKTAAMVIAVNLAKAQGFQDAFSVPRWMVLSGAPGRQITP